MYYRKMMSKTENMINAANKLYTYKHLISQNWIKAIVKNIDINDKSVIKFSSITNEKLIDNFIKYLLSEGKEFNKNVLTSIAYEIAYKDISYDYFMTAMNYFEESYISVLSEKISSSDLIEHLLQVNSIYGKAITHISEEYFNIKDTTVIALVKLAELRDDVTGNHLERTKEYATLLAKNLDLDDEYVRKIERASLLHDIGKVGIKDSILLKPGKLTEEEFQEIKQHTVIGARTIHEIIKSTNIDYDYLNMAINIALHHHEKYDGSGYPHNLKREQIPLEARIFALADAYDVIVSKRPYKEASTHKEAVAKIVFDSGKHFDPRIVNTFLKIESSFNKISAEHRELVS